MRSLRISDLMWRGPTLSDSRRGPSPRNASSEVNAGNHTTAFILFVLLTIPTAHAAAQRAAPIHAAAPAHSSTRPALRRSTSPKSSLALARQAHPSPQSRRSSPLSLLAPFLGDSFNPDDFSPNSDPSQPPPMLLQAANALSGADFPNRPSNTREPSSNQPLLIELHGDHYVRIDNAAINGEALPLNLAPNNLHPSSAQLSKSIHKNSTRPDTPNSAPTPTLAASSPPRDLPPALLIFQDGHSEEVREYTIADGFLYARGDFYTNGYWNKKIALSTLNLPQTLQANSTRNVKFALPAFPNEVITRP